MQQLFEEYLACGGDWMQSSLVLNVTQKASSEISGKQRYVRYIDLRKQHGVTAARMIRESKRELQKQLEKKPDPSQAPWVMPHPDLPGSEDP